MTVELLEPSPPYVIGATGPYGVPHSYAAAADLVVRADGEVLVRDVDWTVVPTSSPTGGDVHLTPEALARVEGRRLTIERAARVQQAWEGVAGPREKGLERQLDAAVRASQDASARAARALRMPPGVEFDGELLGLPAAGQTLIVSPDGKRFVPGPHVSRITEAQTLADAAAGAAQASAEDAAASRVAAEAARDGAQTVFSDWLVEVFDGYGGETEFELAFAPGALGNTFVTVGGVTLTPGVDYEIDAANPRLIVLAAEPGTAIVVRYGRTVSTAPKGDKGDKGDPGQGLTPNATGTLAGRSDHDGAAAGFVYLATDEEPARLYIRQGPSGWSEGLPFQGPEGAPGYLADQAALYVETDQRHPRLDENLADLPDKIAARGALEVARRQDAPQDPASGRGMINGAWGLGGQNVLTVAPAGGVWTHLDLVDRTSFARVNVDVALAVGVPIATSCIAQTISYAPNYAWQELATVSNATPRKWQRQKNAGVWSPFREVWSAQTQIALGATPEAARSAIDAAWKDYVWPEEFGAVGNGVADDTAALKACAASGRKVRGKPGSVYRVHNATETDGVYTEGVPQDWADMVIRQTGRGAALNFAGGWEHIRTVTAIETSVDLSDTTGFYTQLVISGSAAEYYHGARIKIAADAPLPQMSAHAELGEWAVAQGVYDGKIRIAGSLKFAYAPGLYTVRVGILKRTRFSIRNVRVETPLGLGVSHTARGLIIINRGYNTRLEDISIPHHYDRGLRILNSVDTVVTGNDFASGGNHTYQPAEFSDETRGYCVHSANCWGTRIISNVASSARHFCTFTATNGTPAGTLDGYGPDEDGVCALNDVLNMTDAAFQTHHGAHNTLFMGNSSVGCRGAAYSARGIGISFIGNNSFGDRDVLYVLKQHETSITAGISWQGGKAVNPRRNIMRCSDSPVDVLMQGLMVEYRGGAPASLPGALVCDTTALFLLAGSERVQLADIRIRADATTFTALQAIIRDPNAASTFYCDDVSVDFSSTVVIPAESVAFYYDSGPGSPALRINNTRTRIVNGSLHWFLRGTFADESRFWGINSPGTTIWSDTKTIAQSHALAQFAGACRVAGILIEPRAITSIASIPSYVGQVATSGGGVYVAVGTSTAADWKRIDNA